MWRIIVVPFQLLVIVISWVAVSGSDYILPRPTGVTVTNATVECLDVDGCSAAVACTTTPEVALEDHDFAAVEMLSYGDLHQTRVRRLRTEGCAVRVTGQANVTGYRYLKLKRADDTIRYTGMVEVPLQRAGTVVNVRLADVEVDTLPFLIVVVEALVKPDAPVAELNTAEDHVRSVLTKLGFTEHTDYRLMTLQARVDVTDAEADVLAQSSSGPATDRFRKAILEAIDYRMPAMTHGLVFVGVVSEWPTGRDHGSYQLAGPDVQFVSFCATLGALTCSIKEDCLGHELGHAFGLEHDRHGWYGFPLPTQAHRDAVWRMTRCAPEPDHGWPDGEWDDSLLHHIGG